MPRGRTGYGASARPARQPRPVRAPGVAVPGVPHPGTGDLRRPALRLIWRVLWFALTHPRWTPWPRWWSSPGSGWAGPASRAWRRPPCGLAGLRVMQPAWFARFVAAPVRDWLRWWFYRRRWKAAMTLAGLAPDYRGQPMLPVLDRVHRAGAVDLVRVGLVTGQAPADFAARAENLAHAFGARLCRVRGAAPGMLVLELVRADTLTDPIPALPITGEVDLTGLPVGRCEDGSRGGCG